MERDVDFAGLKTWEIWSVGLTRRNSRIKVGGWKAGVFEGELLRGVGVLKNDVCACPFEV
jgi:hypothetical protein